MHNREVPADHEGFLLQFRLIYCCFHAWFLLTARVPAGHRGFLLTSGGSCLLQSEVPAGYKGFLLEFRYIYCCLKA